jgi:uncharacterized small protein (DUF1192 family)
MTKQAEDDKTADFFDTGKRGPGRQKTGMAMTEAQRSKRYRDNRKARIANGSLILPPSYETMERRIAALDAENVRLAAALQEARGRIGALERALMRQESGDGAARHGNQMVLI